jgi:hypothetical protein
MDRVVVYVPRCVQNGSKSLGLKPLQDFDVRTASDCRVIINPHTLQITSTHKVFSVFTSRILATVFNYSTHEVFSSQPDFSTNSLSNDN